MRFEYAAGAKDALQSLLPSGIDYFESILCTTHHRTPVEEISVSLLTPGLSGAAVFLVHRISQGKKFISWVAKVANDIRLIDQERDNYLNFIKDRLSAVPKLVNQTNPHILFYEFAGQAGMYSPETLRNGYSKSSPEALSALMMRVVREVRLLQHYEDDSMTPIDRMIELDSMSSLYKRLDNIVPTKASQLIDGWNKIISLKHNCPMIRSRGHGDLNSGNVLFEAGSAAASPFIIDFASMARSKDNTRHKEGFHFPFWDFAKLERDIVATLFLDDAIKDGLNTNQIIIVARFVLGSICRIPPDIASSNSVRRLIATLVSLRKETRKVSVPEYYEGCYKCVLAYAFMGILFRAKPDSEFPQGIQGLVATESAISLLERPFEELSSLDPLTLWAPDDSNTDFKIKHIQSLYSASSTLSSIEDIRLAAASSINIFGNASTRSRLSQNLSQDMIELADLARLRLSLMNYKEYSSKNLLEEYFSKTSLKNMDFFSGDSVSIKVSDVVAGAPEMASDIIWCCSFFAQVENTSILWGKAFVNIENGRSELLLDNRPEAWTGKPLLINNRFVSKLKLESDSFTRLALETMERIYRIHFDNQKSVTSFGGFLKDANLRQFQSEFALRQNMSSDASEDQLAQQALRVTSFGKARIQLGITKFDIRIMDAIEGSESQPEGINRSSIVVVIDATRP